MAVDGASGAGEVQRLADALCRRAGLSPPVALQSLSGGRNNRVLRLALADGGQAVLKCYYRDPRGGQGRLEAEWSFLRYAAARRVREVPKLLACDSEAHAALLSFVKGRRLDPGAVAADHVAQALEFIRRLNAAPRQPAHVPPGAEACFSLAAHLAVIEQRFARLDTIEPETDLHREARLLVAADMRRSWQDIRARVTKAAQETRLALDEALPRDAVCISPSDFGFHNALVEEGGRLIFLDFEHAGHDDPAKLVCDFFCQPEIPVPLCHLDGFANGVMAALGLGELHTRRVHLLIDVYRMKWLCIMLNDFLPTDAARRAFAHAGSRAERLRRQLAKASKALSVMGGSSLSETPTEGA